MAYVQKLTDQGRDVIAIGQTGETITFTRVQLGRGEVTVEEIPAMTELVLPVLNAAIVSVARTHLAQVTITAKVPLSTIVSDFHLTEIGVFATVGNAPEVLYGVSVVEPGGVPGVISPEMGGGSTAEHTIAVAVLIGTTENVTAIFDPDIELVNIGPPSVGPGVYKDRIGVQFRLRRLVPGASMMITEEPDLIRFAAIAVPAGAMLPFAGQSAPQGWLLCDGSQYPKAEFTALAALLGNTYGGTGEMFAVPDCRDRTLIGRSATRALGATGGAETHVLTIAELANHGHPLYDPGHNHSTWEPAHGHILSDPGHAHGAVASGGGGFSVRYYQNYQPGHALRFFFRATGTVDEGVNARVFETTTGLPTVRPVRYAADELLVGTNATVGIYAAGTGVQVVGATTGLQVNLAYPTHFGMAVQAAGGGQAHNNMQPYLAISYIIKT